MSGCAPSPARLGVERIDLVQLHRIDAQVPIADQIGVCVDAQNAGKIGAFGCRK